MDPESAGWEFELAVIDDKPQLRGKMGGSVILFPLGPSGLRNLAMVGASILVIAKDRALLDAIERVLANGS